MKAIRIAGAVAVALAALMNVGVSTSSNSHVATRVLVPVLGVAGLVAVYGLIRRTTWGGPAALLVSAINAVGGVVGVAIGVSGAGFGLVVGAIALVLVFLALNADHPRPASLA